MATEQQQYEDMPAERLRGEFETNWQQLRQYGRQEQPVPNTLIETLTSQVQEMIDRTQFGLTSQAGHKG